MKLKLIISFLLIIASMSVVIGVTDDDILANTVNYWKFENNLTDSSLNDKTLTFSGTPSYVSGKVGNAVHFDSGEYVYNLSGTNEGSSGYTVMCWAKIDVSSSGADPIIFSSLTSFNGFEVMRRTTGASGELRIYQGTGSNYEFTFSNNAITTNTWTLLGVTVNGTSSSTHAIYNNNTEQSGGTPTASGLHSPNTGEFRLGIRIDGLAGTQLIGEIDDCLIMNKTITQEELNYFYNDSFGRELGASEPANESITYNTKSVNDTRVYIDSSVNFNSNITFVGTPESILFNITTPYGTNLYVPTSNSSGVYYVECNSTNSCKTNQTGTYTLNNIFANLTTGFNSTEDATSVSFELVTPITGTYFNESFDCGDSPNVVCDNNWTETGETGDATLEILNNEMKLFDDDVGSSLLLSIDNITNVPSYFNFTFTTNLSQTDKQLDIELMEGSKRCVNMRVGLNSTWNYVNSVPTTVDTFVTYQSNISYEHQVLVNISTDTYDWYVNGSLIGDDISFRDTNCTFIDTIRIASGTTNVLTGFYLDSVSICDIDGCNETITINDSITVNNIAVNDTLIFNDESVFFSADIIGGGTIESILFNVTTPYGNFNFAQTSNSSNTFNLLCNSTNTCKTNQTGTYTLNNIFVNLTTGYNLTKVSGLSFQVSNGSWWNTTFNNRQQVNIKNVSGTVDKLIFDTKYLINNGMMQSDCSDIRVIDEDGINILHHWFDDNECNTKNMTLWIKNNYTDDDNFHIYFNNPTVSNSMNGSLVFNYFTDFTSNDGWTLARENPTPTFNYSFFDRTGLRIYSDGIGSGTLIEQEIFNTEDFIVYAKTYINNSYSNNYEFLAVTNEGYDASAGENGYHTFRHPSLGSASGNTADINRASAGTWSNWRNYERLITVGKWDFLSLSKINGWVQSSDSEGLIQKNDTSVFSNLDYISLGVIAGGEAELFVDYLFSANYTNEINEVILSDIEYVSNTLSISSNTSYYQSNINFTMYFQPTSTNNETFEVLVYNSSGGLLYNDTSYSNNTITGVNLVNQHFYDYVNVYAKDSVGENTKKIEFRVLPHYRYSSVSDIHYGQAGHFQTWNETFNDTTYNINKENIGSEFMNFTLVNGDISESFADLTEAKNLLDELTMPYYTLVGNHDLSTTGQWSSLFGYGTDHDVYIGNNVSGNRQIHLILLSSSTSGGSTQCADTTFLSNKLAECPTCLNVVATHVQQKKYVWSGIDCPTFGTTIDDYANNTLSISYGHTHSERKCREDTTFAGNILQCHNGGSVYGFNSRAMRVYEYYEDGYFITYLKNYEDNFLDNVTEVYTRQFDVTIDNSNIYSPVIHNIISNTPSNENTIANITINASDQDGDTLTYAVNDSNFVENVTGTFLWNTSSEDSGSYNISVNVTDGTFTATSSLIFVVNNSINSAPTISITTPSNNSLFNNDTSSINISWVASDFDNDNISVNITLFSEDKSSVVEQILYQLNTISSLNYTLPTTLEANYVLEIAVNDSNNSIVKTNHNLTIDLIPPSVNITYPIQNTSFASNVITLNYTSNDTLISDCWYSLNDELVYPGDCSGTTSVTLASSTNNSIVMYVNDTAGNVVNDTVYDINYTEDVVEETSSGGGGGSGGFSPTNQPSLITGFTTSDSVKEIYEGGGLAPNTILYGIELVLEKVYYALFKYSDDSKEEYSYSKIIEREKEYYKCLSLEDKQCVAFVNEELEIEIERFVSLNQILLMKNIELNNTERVNELDFYIRQNNMLMLEVQEEVFNGHLETHNNLLIRIKNALSN